MSRYREWLATLKPCPGCGRRSADNPDGRLCPVCDSDLEEYVVDYDEEEDDGEDDGDAA